ncbi:Membrane-associated phospholipid phosphatase [Flavobacterium micromati]|uniref:Membrane-associated phospholipid phosphatase n=1 Tax=Flavobacterium micromati TaxID=229205 RepID=A0A1M5R1P2_9FLAO|nr:phosphatase PAP2 family protein [Flavobacterium micromati]SHH20304.1 Membrane-associated phospholipid phosphatase [Flavobacterium micromati]
MAIVYAVIFVFLILVLIINQKSYWGDNKIITLNFKREITICLVCVGIAYASGHFHKNKASNHINFEIGSLKKTEIEKINSIDKIIAGRWDISAKDNGKIFNNIAIYLIPLSIFFFTGSVKRRLALFFVFSQGYWLTDSLTGLTKGLVNRYRPFAYITHNEIEKLSLRAKEKFFEDIVDYDIQNSFFSGDASLTAFGFMFFAISYSSFYKDSKLKSLIWILAIIGTLLGCYFRALSGKHFPTDVLIGGLVGTAIAFGIIRIHKNASKPIEL